MAPGQISVVVGLLEIMLDPLARSLANARIDDEPESGNERKSVGASEAHPDQGISNEEILAEFGLSQEQFEVLGRTPSAPDPMIRVDRDA